MILQENIKDGRNHLGDESYVFKSISPLLIDNGDVVTVSFEATTPTTGDWIGAYSPADVDVTQSTPVKYGWCDEGGESYMLTGTGSLLFNMTNLREDVVFYYFTNATYSPILVGASEQKLTFKNPNQPLRPRVVATGDLDVLNLHWSSATSTKPTLKWGTESGVYSNELAAVTSSIGQEEMCGSPANSTGWRDLGLIHSAPLEGMKALADTKIYYIFGDAATDDFSGEFVFFVPPLPGIKLLSESERLSGTSSPLSSSAGKDKKGEEGEAKKESSVQRPTRAILFDDAGRGSMDDTYTWNEYGRPALYTMQAVGEEVRQGMVDVVYHGGDISYATGYAAVWDVFMDMISPVAASIVYLSTVGNHESDWYDSATYLSNGDSGGECGVMSTRLLPMPEPATTNKPWWSYEVGMIHFVGMSTEHEYEIGSEQYLWLENDLKNVDRTVTPWLIFGGHRAMYLNSDYGGSVTSDIAVMDKMILNIEPLLYKYRANIGFYGHNHVVQRHSAVLQKEVVQASVPIKAEDGHTIHYHEDPQATVQMVVGTAGAMFTKNAVNPPPEWNEMWFYLYGYARVTAVNSTYLDWEWVHSETGKVLDHMVITQTDPTKPWDAEKQKAAHNKNKNNV